ncbi:MAG: hypothetical protein RCG15_06135 [Candidatus Rickettsia vulgarisii]
MDNGKTKGLTSGNIKFINETLASLIILEEIILYVQNRITKLDHENP